MMKKQMTIKETLVAVNRNNVAPFIIIYDVMRVRLDEGGECVAFKKSASLADHSAPSFWCCSHEHASWNEAAGCAETPLSGAGDFLEPDQTEQSNSS
jgi:hypothetical protein